MESAFKAVVNTFDGDWKKVVNKWALMNGHYVAEFGDLPAWYVETSNTAMLAAAAWQCGCPALCEPRINKQKFTGRPGRPKTYVGRLDMEIYIDDHWTWVEAKKDHFQFTQKKDGRSERRQRFVNLIESSRKSAENSASSAKECGWNVSAAAFFSASVVADSVERGDDKSARDGLGKEDAVSRAINSEIEAMLERLEKYKLKTGASLKVAVFGNTNSRLQEWTTVDYPAAFGIIMLDL